MIDTLQGLMILASSDTLQGLLLLAVVVMFIAHLRYHD